MGTTLAGFDEELPQRRWRVPEQAAV